MQKNYISLNAARTDTPTAIKRFKTS